MNSSPRGRILLVILLVIIFTACLAGLPGALYNRLPKQEEIILSPQSTLVNNAAYTIPTPVVVYYQVEGKNETDLVKEIQSKGPSGYAGYTNWNIRWGWPGYGQAECDLSKTWIKLKITLTLPEWDPPAGVSSELIEKWTLFSQDLHTHEQGHVDNVIRAMPLILNSIQRSDCITADSAAEHVLDELRGWDVQYDSKTDHGRTQGAVFP
jgi:predicted secreted Zn-dependent protease